MLMFPVLAFGWLTTAQILPGPPDFERAFPPDPAYVAILFLAVGAALVVVGSTLLTVGDFVRGTSTPRPIALPVVALSALVAVGQLSISRASLNALWIWLEVVLTAGCGFLVLLAGLVLVRALVGLWSAPELTMWPGRRAATVLLLLAALAATSVQDGHTNDLAFGFGSYATFVPMAEEVRMELTGQVHHSVWRYHYDETIGL